MIFISFQLPKWNYTLYHYEVLMKFCGISSIWFVTFVGKFQHVRWIKKIPVISSWSKKQFWILWGYGAETACYGSTSPGGTLQPLHHLDEAVQKRTCLQKTSWEKEKSPGWPEKSFFFAKYFEVQVTINVPWSVHTYEIDKHKNFRCIGIAFLIVDALIFWRGSVH